MQFLTKRHLGLGISAPVGSHVARPTFIRGCGIEALRMSPLTGSSPIITRGSHATAVHPKS
jgi:hypothetical protein